MAVRSAAPSPANVDFLDHFVAAVARTTAEVCDDRYQQLSITTDEASGTATTQTTDTDPHISDAVSRTTTSSERRETAPMTASSERGRAAPLSRDNGVLTLTLTPESEDLLRSLRVWDFTAGGMLAYPFDLQALDAYVASVPISRNNSDPCVPATWT